jgi:aspartate racemase
VKLVGLLGGMSWESTDYYYQQMNNRIRDRLGGLHSAHCLIYSVDFAEVEAMQAAGAWEEAGAYLGERARRLQAAGAECIVLCTNTMHRVYEAVQAAVTVPVLHIADGTAQALENAGVRRVALLGTRYTMEQAFYRERLEQRGLVVMVPDAEDRSLVHKVIYDELCLGQILETSRRAYEEIVTGLARDGAEAVILGCTEIGLLIGQNNSPVPVFDTTLLHVETALNWALNAR